MHPTRRNFLRGVAALSGVALAAPGSRTGLTIRIARKRVEIARGHTIDTVAYNDAVPAPLIRLREGVPVEVELINDTATPEFVHWHGLIVSIEADGSQEEGSPAVPAHGRLRYRLLPQPSGSRYVHTHAMSMGDLNQATFSGQYGFVYIEPASEPGDYDREVFLSTHEWDPYVAHMAEHGQDSLEVGYRRHTINGRCLGHGDPVRVKSGQRVMFRILNASATENIQLALPGHEFLVVALDGSPVPNPRAVGILELGTGERVDALVTMNNPGVWVLGAPGSDLRAKGLGIVVEYAGRAGEPQWIDLEPSSWDYALFGAASGPSVPGTVIPLAFESAPPGPDGFERWTINSLPDGGQPMKVSRGERYRLVFDNRSNEAHPVHLHRANFELTEVYGTPTSGILKDVVLVKARRQIAADFTPAVDGLMLFHCHHQIHMEHGFKMLFQVV